MGQQELWSGPVPTLADVFRARQVIRPYLKPTPVIEAPALSERLGCQVVVKCENLQPIGAFKIRGGVYLLSQLPERQKAAGIVGASTGNHGQSIAYAARLFGTQATIFVPNGANELKVRAMRRLGAEVVFAEDAFNECHDAAMGFAEEHRKTFIHSADEPALIAGVGTATLELMDEHPDVSAIFVAAGGGSGACGACITGKGISPDLKVYAVQAEGAPAIHDSWRKRELKKLGPPRTFAEGIATSEAFRLPARILWDMIDDILLVSDSDLRRSMLTILETTRMMAEGAGAAGLAGLYQRRHEFEGKKVAVMLSGGNLSLEALQQALAGERPL